MVFFFLCILEMDKELQSRLHNFETYFDVGSKLGSGQFGSVYQIHCRQTGTIYAIKVFDLNKITQSASLENNILREATLLYGEQLVYVINTYGICEVDIDNDSYIGICLEYFHGQSLDTIPMEYWTDATTLPLMQQILLGIIELHDREIVHRDIKVENILLNLDTNAIKIIDLGFSCKIDQCHRFEGSPIYVSPEVYQYALTHCRHFPPDVLKPNDIWALGVTFLILVTDEDPFEGDDWKEIGQHVVNNDRISITPNPATPYTHQLIDYCLQPIDQRPTAHQLLQHVKIFFDSTD
jgi:serine/threonine protein kinase